MGSYLSAYNSLWPLRYKKQAQVIKQVSEINLDVYHIGSTSIPNLRAKDCIDMLGVIENFQLGPKLINALKSLGYDYRGEYGIKGRHYFVKKQPHKFHLHIFAKGDEQIEKHLKFVEKMSKNSELVLELNQLKLDLVQKNPADKNKYQQQKSSFYKKIGCDF